MTAWNHRPTWVNWRRDEQQRTRTNPRRRWLDAIRSQLYTVLTVGILAMFGYFAFKGVRAWPCHGAGAERANGGLLLGSPRLDRAGKGRTLCLMTSGSSTWRPAMRGRSGPRISTQQSQPTRCNGDQDSDPRPLVPADQPGFPAVWVKEVAKKRYQLPHGRWKYEWRPPDEVRTVVL